MTETETPGIIVEYVDALPEVLDLRPPAPAEGEPLIDTRPLPELAGFCSEPLARMIMTAPEVRMTHGKIRSELSMITPRGQTWTPETLSMWVRVEQRKKVLADDGTGQLNIAVELPDGRLLKWYPGFTHPDRPDLAPDGSPIPGIPRPAMRGELSPRVAPQAVVAPALTTEPEADEDFGPEPAEDVTVPLTFTETRDVTYTESRRVTGDIEIPRDVVGRGVQVVRDWLVGWGEDNEGRFYRELEITSEGDWNMTDDEYNYGDTNTDDLRSRDINSAAAAAVAQ